MPDRFQSFLLALFASTHVCAYACQPATDVASDVIRKSSNIVVGYITGERYPDYHAYVLGGADPETDVVWGRRVVDLIVVDYLKGSGPLEISADVPCGSRFPAVKKRVLATISSGGEAVLLFTPTEESLRMHLKNIRER